MHSISSFMLATAGLPPSQVELESPNCTSLIRPIVLVLTWLSSKLTVTVWPKQPGFVTAHATVFLMAIGRDVLQH